MYPQNIFCQKKRKFIINYALLSGGLFFLIFFRGEDDNEEFSIFGDGGEDRGEDPFKDSFFHFEGHLQKQMESMSRQMEEMFKNFGAVQFPSGMGHMGLVARKPVFRVSVKASFKPVSSATETSSKIKISSVASLHILLS